MYSRYRSPDRLAALLLLIGLAACDVAEARGEALEEGRAEALRVCADPNNLPFSNEAGRGFENALAELVAEATGRIGVEYVWWPQRRGFIRNTLGAGRCDVVMGVPAGYELARPTRPYYRSSYVFVYRADAGFQISRIGDPRLRELRVGVPVVGDDYASTPGAAALARRGIIDNLVGFSVYGDYSEPHPPSRIIEAVADGRIDVAIAWGPLAGYFASRQAAPLEVVPVQSADAEEQATFTFGIAMATRREDDELNNTLNRLIADREQELRALLTRYHVPLLDIHPSAEESHES